MRHFIAICSLACAATVRYGIYYGLGEQACISTVVVRACMHLSRPPKLRFKVRSVLPAACRRIAARPVLLCCCAAVLLYSCKRPSIEHPVSQTDYGRSYREPLPRCSEVWASVHLVHGPSVLFLIVPEHVDRSSVAQQHSIPIASKRRDGRLQHRFDSTR